MKRILIGLVLLTAIQHTQARASQIVIGGNAIVNGNAETGSTSGWTNATFEAVSYGTGGGFPDNTSPGPVNRGAYFFGGAVTATASGVEAVDASNISALIDAGNASYSLSGYLGGFDTQDDFATLTATFLSATNTTLGNGIIGPVTEAQRNGVTGLLFASSSGVIPVGTRMIDFTLTMTREQGSYNDGYADNLAFVTTAGASTVTPEPSSLVLLGTGILAGVSAIRRRYNS